jgi:hypothetical protein
MIHETAVVWVVIGIGLVVLNLDAIRNGQIGVRAASMYTREDRPRDFWLLVGLFALLGLLMCGFGAWSLTGN